VPAFLAAENIEVECPELGVLKVDVSYGGNFYAIVDVQENFKGLQHYSADQLLPGHVLCVNASMKPTHLCILMMQRLMAAHTFYGQAMCWIKHHGAQCRVLW
jgi:hypothetical protein